MNEELLEGIYDLHVHTAPDISERKLDDIDYAKIMEQYNMAGFCIKSHYFNTAERAKLVKKLHPSIEAIGGLALNNSVGGLNPEAVLMAAKSGAKIIWMPTFDAKNEREYLLNNSYGVLPPWAQVQKNNDNKQEVPGITILEDKQIKEEVKEIVAICKERDLILASGHLSKSETLELAKYARNEEFKKLVITHPTFSSIAFSIEEQLELLEFGATLEQCYGVVQEHYGISWGGMYEIFNRTGDKNVIISSDLGQIENPFPHEGLLDFINKLLEQGFSKQFVKNITRENQLKLLGG